MIIAASRNASQYIYTICIPEYAKKCKNEGFFIIYQQIVWNVPVVMTHISDPLH